MLVPSELLPYLQQFRKFHRQPIQRVQDPLPLDVMEAFLSALSRSNVAMDSCDLSSIFVFASSPALCRGYLHEQGKEQARQETPFTSSTTERQLPIRWVSVVLRLYPNLRRLWHCVTRCLDLSPSMASSTLSTPPKWNSKQIKQMAAGGGAGIVAKTVVAPFERVKIVCQTGESVGMLQTTRSIFVSEGILGFWRGNMAACVRVVPHKAVLFAFSDFYKELFRSMNAQGEMPRWGPFVSGSLSGFTASIVTYPLDLIRTRVSGQIGENLVYSGIAHTFMRTLKEEGPRALFRGIGPTLFGALPYEGIKFGSYDILTGLLPEDIDPKASFVGKIMCGGGAGVLATIFTYPNDTVRRRLQMQGAGGVTRQYKNAWDCYVKLARNEGWTVYYRGLTPTLVRAMPNMGVQFATYDFFKGFI